MLTSTDNTISKEFEMKNVVYRIRNKVNGRFYIGSSSDFNTRKKAHEAQINQGVHASYLLENDLSLRGLQDFEFKVLRQFETREGMLKLEQALINMYWGTKVSYNVNPEVYKGAINDVIIAWNMNTSEILTYLSTHAVKVDLGISKSISSRLLAKNLIEHDAWVLDLASKVRDSSEVISWYEMTGLPNAKAVRRSYMSKPELRLSNASQFCANKSYIAKRLADTSEKLKISINSRNKVKNPFNIPGLNEFDIYVMRRGDIEDKLFGFGKTVSGFMRNYIDPLIEANIIFRRRCTGALSREYEYGLTSHGFKLARDGEFGDLFKAELILLAKSLYPEFSKDNFWREFGGGLSKNDFFHLLDPYIEAGFVVVKSNGQRSVKYIACPTY